MKKAHLCVLAIVVLLVMLTTSLDISAQDAKSSQNKSSLTPAPTPQQSTPTLEETLSWLQQKFNGYIVKGFYYIDIDSGTERRMSSFVFRDCSMTWMAGEHGDTNLEANKITLSDVDPSKIQMRKVQTANGTPYWKLRLESYNHEKQFDLKSPGFSEVNKYVVMFYINDEAISERIVKALTHTVKQCGGGQEKREPF